MWLNVSTLEDSIEEHDIELCLVTGEYRYRLAYVRPILGYFMGAWQAGLPYYYERRTRHGNYK